MKNVLPLYLRDEQIFFFFQEMNILYNRQVQLATSRWLVQKTLL